MRSLLDSLKVGEQKQSLQRNQEIKQQEKAYEIRQGGWNSKEQKMYLQFLEGHRRQFKSSETRRESKIFKEMSIFIGSRDGSQCRSHHMKQLKSHKTIGKLLRAAKKKAEKSSKKNQSLDSQQNPASLELQPTFLEPYPVYLLIPTFTLPTNFYK